MKNDFREFYDEEYIMNTILDEEEDFLEHAWKDHKYLYIDKNGNYVYPEDLVKRGRRAVSTVTSAAYNKGRNLISKAAPYVRNGLGAVAGVARRAVQVGKQEYNRIKSGHRYNYDPNGQANEAQRRKNMLRYIIRGNNPGNAKYKNIDAINSKIKQNEANRLAGNRSKSMPAVKPGEKWKYDSKSNSWIRTQKASTKSSSTKKNQNNIYRTDRLKDDWTPNKKQYGGLDTKSARNEKFGSKSSSSSSKKKNTQSNSLKEYAKRMGNDAKSTLNNLSSYTKHKVKSVGTAIGNKDKYIEKRIKKANINNFEDAFAKLHKNDLQRIANSSSRRADHDMRVEDAFYRILSKRKKKK